MKSAWPKCLKARTSPLEYWDKTSTLSTFGPHEMSIATELAMDILDSYQSLGSKLVPRYNNIPGGQNTVRSCAEMKTKTRPGPTIFNPLFEYSRPHGHSLMYDCDDSFLPLV